MTLTHELAPLLHALGRAGIELAPHPTDANRLRHRPAVLPPDLSSQLRLHRVAVAVLLRDGYAPADEDAAYVLRERLCVAGDRAIPTHPGSPAWLLAVGESIGGGDTPQAMTPPPSVAERLADVLSAALGVPLRVSSLPPGERFPGEPEWRMPTTTRNSCEIATRRVHSGHGATDAGHNSGSEGERSNALRDRQGRGRGP